MYAHFTGLTSTTPSFLAKDGCICPGADVRNLTYECTTIGPGNTHWRGTAFNCPGKGNEISLLHSQFGAGGSSAECNNGNITGRSLRVEGNCYTSQLFVVYSQDLLGQSVVCAHNNLVTEEVVGNATIAITTGTYYVVSGAHKPPYLVVSRTQFSLLVNFHKFY